MAELNCRCLNVTIHLDNSEVQFDSPVKPSDLLINTKKVLTSEDLYEVKLGAAGIAVVSCTVYCEQPQTPYSHICLCMCIYACICVNVCIYVQHTSMCMHAC